MWISLGVHLSLGLHLGLALCMEGCAREGVHLILPLPGLLKDAGPQAVGTILHLPQVHWVFMWGGVCVRWVLMGAVDTGQQAESA